MTTLDWVIVLSYLILLLVIGFKVKDQSKHSDDYFKGSSKFSWFVIALSILATQISAVTFIGGPGWSYNSGMKVFMFYASIPLVFWFVSNYFAPFFYSLKIISIYEFLEKRFNTKLKVLVATGFILKIILVLGSIVYAPSFILNRLVGIDIYLAIAICGITTILYTLLGGLKAVMLTDTVQMIIFWLGLAVVIFIVMDSINFDFKETLNYAQSQNKANPFDFSIDLTKADTFISGFIGALFFNIAYYGMDQTEVQRFVCAKDMATVKKSLRISGYVTTIQMFIIFLTGLMLLFYFQGKEFDTANDVFLEFIVKNVPSGLIGLVVAALLSGSMSTISSALNSVVTVFIKDIYQSLVPDSQHKNLIVLARISTLIIGILVMIQASLFTSLKSSFLEIVIKYPAYLVGPIAGVFILGIFTKRTSSLGAGIGFVLGIILAVIITDYYNIYQTWNAFIGGSLTITIGYLISFILKNKKQNEIYKYTIHGIKESYKENDKIKENGVYLVPGKIDKSSNKLLVFQIAVLVVLYIIS